MSLVAYDASSSSEQDSDEEVDLGSKPSGNKVIVPGNISDEDDYNGGEFSVGVEVKRPISSLVNSLPKPKNVETEEEKDLTVSFTKLPMPKAQTKAQDTILEEEDDEFLHKKPEVKEISLPKATTTTTSKKAPVKISIPSLKEFADVDKERASKSKNPIIENKPKGCGLLSILPKAKSERNFAKDSMIPATSSQNVGGSSMPSNAVSSRRPAFIPDTVKNRRSAYNTENVDGISTNRLGKINKKPQKLKAALVNCSDSDESEDEKMDDAAAADFFALNSEVKLPEVSLNEINALVAKRAAQISQGPKTYLERMESSRNDDTEEIEVEVQPEAHKRLNEQKLQDEAMQALIGSSAKRRRKQEAIEVMDLASHQVLPSRDEWMRTALASSTSYQATGVLVDEEPAAGTRRKHQITYLAHKAKANEAELQAMWAANRMNRRATQSKYGF